MDAYERKREEDFKNGVIMGFGCADAIASRVAYAFNDTKKRRESDIVQPWDSFPTLFENERNKVTQTVQKADVENYKNSMKAFAERWNRRIKDASENSI